MTATNHAITGALIGLISGRPLIALPVAVLSHFICDALPHFGVEAPDDRWIRAKAFRNLLLVDSLLCVVLVLVLAAFHPTHWVLAAICAFVATSPDLVWINHFLKARRGQTWRPNWFERFAAAIQWFEKPIGAVVEAVWLVIGLSLLSVFVR